MDTSITISRHGYGATQIDRAVEIQNDILKSNKKPLYSYNGEEWFESGHTTRNELEFESKRYVVTFQSVQGLLGKSALGTRRFLAAINAKAWTIDGKLHYALDEVLSALAGHFPEQAEA